MQSRLIGRFEWDGIWKRHFHLNVNVNRQRFLSRKRNQLFLWCRR